MTERRRDPVTGQWRMFASHRQDRTFLPSEQLCPLCPTVDGDRPTEIPRPSFEVAVFDNRFPALTAHPPPPAMAGSDLYPVAPALGANEVVVYSDQHQPTAAELGPARMEKVIAVWAERYGELGRRDEIAYVFIFENRGEAIGVTLHHPHGQIYAYPEIPPLPATELAAATAYLEATGRCVLCDVVARERSDGVRLVAQNGSFVAFVPFAARFPYEVHVASRRHATSVTDLTDPERRLLAELLVTVRRGLDGLFGFPLPLVMSVHQAPTDDAGWLPVSHLHIEFTPVHRNATKLKYLAGSELGGGAFINDAAPETTAAAIRVALLTEE